MNVVENYGAESLAEILSILRERGRRSGGSFLIGTDGIKRILQQRFGLSKHESSRMLRHIERVLLDNDVFKLWDMKTKGTVIYSVNVVTLG